MVQLRWGNTDPIAPIFHKLYYLFLEMQYMLFTIRQQL